MPMLGEHQDAGSAVDAATAVNASIDGGAVDASTTATLDAAVEAMYRRICAAMNRCEKRSTDAPEACVQLLRTASSGGANTFNSLEAAVAGIDAGVVELVRPIEDCLRDLETRACDDAPMLDLFTPCRGSFRGTLAAGARCISSAACGKGLTCENRNPSGCEGKCVAIPAGMCLSDADCTAPKRCTEGLYQCQVPAEPAPEGADCPVGTPCAAGLLCSYEPPPGAEFDPDGHCVVAPAAGASCRWTNRCAAGLDCRFDDMTCGVSPGIGENCGELVQCATPLACDDTTQACQVIPREGRCLMELGQPTCGGPNWCDTSGSIPTCTPIRPVGAQCASEAECGRNPCEGGVCGLPKPPRICTW